MDTNRETNAVSILCEQGQPGLNNIKVAQIIMKIATLNMDISIDCPHYLYLQPSCINVAYDKTCLSGTLQSTS